MRCRPLSGSELARGESSVVSLLPQAGVVQVTDSAALGHGESPGKTDEGHKFAYDYAWGGDSTQDEVWEALGLPLLDSAFSGFNSTIFAYGMTGSGKTYCMAGPDDLSEDGSDRGIVPRLTGQLFERIGEASAANSKLKFLVQVGYLEIYNEQLRDLLAASDVKGARSGGELRIVEDAVRGVHVRGLSEIVVNDAAHMEALMRQGDTARKRAATAQNARSSRSHSLFLVRLNTKEERDDGSSSGTVSRLNLVDLAGSERAGKVGSTGDRLKEGNHINVSLSALSLVITKLSEVASSSGGRKKKVFVPYRNSKLTRVLQESLGGNSRTTMLATLSPAKRHLAETLTTLRYASRARRIKITAVKNETGAEVSKLRDEVETLKAQLAAAAGDVDARVEYESRIADYETQLKQTWEDKAAASRALEEQQAAAAAAIRAAEEEAERKREAERRQWLAVIADKADVALTLRVAVRPESANAAAEATCDGWIANVVEATSADAAARDQAAYATVFKEALEADIGRVADLLDGIEGLSGAVDASTLAGIKSGLTAAQDKLSRLQEEINTLYTTQKTAVAAWEALAVSVRADIDADDGEQVDGETKEGIEEDKTDDSKDDDSGAEGAAGSTSVEDTKRRRHRREAMQLVAKQVEDRLSQSSSTSAAQRRSLSIATAASHVQRSLRGVCAPESKSTGDDDDGTDAKEDDAEVRSALESLREARDSASAALAEVEPGDAEVPPDALEGGLSALVNCVTAAQAHSRAREALRRRVEGDAAKRLEAANEALAAKLSAMVAEHNDADASLQEQLAAALAGREEAARRADALEAELASVAAAAEEAAAAARSTEAQLRADLLRQEAEAERARAEAASLREELATHKEATENAVRRAERAEAAQADAVAAAEAASSGAQVLQEERDDARANEERYYLELEEAREEIDRIQAGYIGVSDRLNDTLDELQETRDALEAERELRLRGLTVAAPARSVPEPIQVGAPRQVPPATASKTAESDDGGSDAYGSDEYADEDFEAESPTRSARGSAPAGFCEGD